MQNHRILKTLTIVMLATIIAQSSMPQAQGEIPGGVEVYRDSSGNGNALQAVNGVAQSEGYSVTGLGLDGTGYARALHRASLNTSSGLTVALWMNASASMKNAGTFWIWTKGTHYLAIGSGSLEYNVRIAGADKFVDAPGASWYVSAWTFIVGTWNSTDNTVRIYVDGVDVADTSTSGAISNNTSNMTVGCSGTGLQCFSGQVDNLTILNKGVTSAEVSQLMGGTYAGTGIIARYDFDEVGHTTTLPTVTVNNTFSPTNNVTTSVTANNTFSPTNNVTVNVTANNTFSPTNNVTANVTANNTFSPTNNVWANTSETEFVNASAYSNVTVNPLLNSTVFANSTLNLTTNITANASVSLNNTTLQVPGTMNVATAVDAYIPVVLWLGLFLLFAWTQAAPSTFAAFFALMAEVAGIWNPRARFFLGFLMVGVIHGLYVLKRNGIMPGAPWRRKEQ